MSLRSAIEAMRREVTPVTSAGNLGLPPKAAPALKVTPVTPVTHEKRKNERAVEFGPQNDPQQDAEGAEGATRPYFFDVTGVTGLPLNNSKASGGYTEFLDGVTGVTSRPSLTDEETALIYQASAQLDAVAEHIRATEPQPQPDDADIEARSLACPVPQHIKPLTQTTVEGIEARFHAAPPGSPLRAVLDWLESIGEKDWREWQRIIGLCETSPEALAYFASMAAQDAQQPGPLPTPHPAADQSAMGATSRASTSLENAR